VIWVSGRISDPLKRSLLKRSSLTEYALSCTTNIIDIRQKAFAPGQVVGDDGTHP